MLACGLVLILVVLLVSVLVFVLPVYVLVFVVLLILLFLFLFVNFDGYFLPERLHPGAGRMGLITGDTDSPSSSGGGGGGGLMGKLSSVASVFSRKKAKPKTKTSSVSRTPPSPPPIAEKAKPQLPPPAKEENKDVTPQKIATASSTAIQGSPPREGEGSQVAEVSAPVSTAAVQQGVEAGIGAKGDAAPPTDATASTVTAEKQKEEVAPLDGEENPAIGSPGTPHQEGDRPTELSAAAVAAETAVAAQELPVGADTEGTAAPPTDATVVVVATAEENKEKKDKGEACSASGKVAGVEEKEACVSTGKVGAETVDPGIRVVSFAVREPSLGASVVGHVAILDGSCYVWAGTEGSALQGSLAAAVATRFDGGMPTATPLLAGGGEGQGDVGGGGVGVSMAQRLCRRTGRVVFVSCDLSEDSQILVAAVESKVLALLKAED